MNRRGFTLIELLVVVAIIALLISILMPSLTQAKEASRRAVCASNMRQMMTGIAYYVHDFHETWPNTVRGSNRDGTAGKGESWTQGSWAMRIRPYLKDIKPFYCPDWDWGNFNLPFMQMYALQYPNSWGGFMTYGMSGGQTNDPSGTYRIGFGLFDPLFVKDSEIKAPSMSYLFAETWGYAPGMGMPYSYLAGAKGCGWSEEQTDVWGLIPGPARSIEVYGLQFRHRKTAPVGLNFTFIDGHVSWQTGEEMAKPLHWRVTGTGVYTPRSGFLPL